MAGVKFFVYAKSGWHEVDTSSGKVVGWRGRAKFVYARRGRLHVARSRGVLRALNAFIAGKPSAIRDGPRLSQQRYSDNLNSRVKALPICDGHHACCSENHRFNNNDNSYKVPVVTLHKIDTSTQYESKVDASTQIDTTKASNNVATKQCNLRINLVPLPRLQLKNVTLEDDIETEQKRPKITKSSKIIQFNGTRKSLRKRSRSIEKILEALSSDESLSDFDIKKSFVNKNVTNHKPKLRSAVPKRTFLDLTLDTSTDTSGVSFEVKIPNKHRRLLRSTPAKRKLSESRRDSTTDEEQNKKIKLTKSNAEKKKIQEISDDTSDTTVIKYKPIPSIQHKTALSSTRDSDSDEALELVNKRQTSKATSTKNTAKPLRSRSETRTPQKQVIPSRRKRAVSSSDEVLCRTDYTDAYNFLRRPGNAKTSSASLEIIIPEEDVIVLREFIERTDCADLEKFDADDDYKRMLFYAINPLVDVEKCSLIEKLLNESKLKKFAERLGLCSVSEVSSQASAYRTRKRANHNKYTESSAGSETDKENLEVTSRLRIENINQKSPKKAMISRYEKSRDKNQELSQRENSNQKSPKKAMISRYEKSKDKNQESMKTPTDRDRYKGQYVKVKVKDKVKKSIDRIAKYNAERHRKTNKGDDNEGSHRSDKKAEEKSVDPTLKPFQFLNRNNKGKFMKRGFTNDCQKRDNATQLDDQTINKCQPPRLAPRLEVSLEKDKNIEQMKDGEKSLEIRKKLRSSTVKNNDSLENTEKDQSRDRSEISSKAKSVENQKVRSDATPKENQVLKKLSDKSRNTEYVEQSTRSRDRSRKSTKSESRTESKENVPVKINRLQDRNTRNAESSQEINLTAESSKEMQKTNSLSRSTHTISKRPSASTVKEYSNLEDHAIVAYVSSGTRASTVKGNQIWRQLQDQYPRITGIDRSWQSLRNRYLRYILPALGAMSLPPAHAARLRAAAATGAIKVKRDSNRRNSIFDKDGSVRGAASRRPRRDHASPARPHPTRGDRDDDSSGHTPPPRSPRRRPPRSSPRYSDVTRQFASRKLRSTPRDSPPETKESPNTDVRKTRKLFNPKVQL